MKHFALALLAGLTLAMASSSASAGRYDRDGWDLSFRFGYEDRGGSYYGGSYGYSSGSRYHDRGRYDRYESRSYRSYDCAPRYYAPRYDDCSPRYYRGHRSYYR